MSIPPILDDLPTGEDALDFTPYVDALSDILLDPQTHTPLTLGIFGSWGSGKTSLMTMLRNRVARSDTDTATGTHRTIWFNAWKYNQEETLWRALLLLLLDDLEQLLEADPPPQEEGQQESAELLSRLRQALYGDATWTEKGAMKPNWSEALMAGAGLAFNLILSGVGLGLAKEVVEEAQKTLGKGEPVSQLSKLVQAFHREEVVQTQAQLRSLEQFQRNFAELVAILLRRRGEGFRRLVVFVDDLDRCLPEKALQVLEALKLFVDVPGVIFVLALDPDAIDAAVRKRYPADAEKAHEYLEKIIQLPFILPPIEDESMRAYVDSLAPALPDPRCADVFARGLSPNPRQVKRTLNIYLLLTRLVGKRAEITGSITPVRLAKIVTIQHAYPELYGLLRLRPGYLSALEAYFRRSQDGERPGASDTDALPPLPEALVPFQALEPLRRLLCLFTEADARFDALKPADLRSYITLTRRATPVEAPAVQAARLPFEPEMVPVPAGAFWMGTSDAQVAAMRKQFSWAKEFDFSREQPQHELTLPTFEIGRYPVTNADYATFVRETGHAAPPHWREGSFPEALADHPVVNVTWFDAQAYVRWLREKTERNYHLPSEAEWEKAARGTDGRLWPWGDDWDPGRANCKPAGPGETTPVDQYSPDGDSPYGCADMAGNVWEWCSSLWGEDPGKPDFGYRYQPDDGREALDAKGLRIVRGGSWYNDGPNGLRCGARDWLNPDDWSNSLGFRVARGSLP